MYIIEIRGTQYQYRNLRHLHQQLSRRMTQLNEQEAKHKQGLADVRDEKRTIGRMLGVRARRLVEDRSQSEAAGVAAR